MLEPRRRGDGRAGARRRRTRQASCSAATGRRASGRLRARRYPAAVSEQPSGAEHSARLPLLTLAAPAASSSLASEAAGRGAHWAAACQEREGERGGWRRAEGRGGCGALPTAGSRRAPAGQLRPPPQSSRGCQPCPRPAPALSRPSPAARRRRRRRLLRGGSVPPGRGSPPPRRDSRGGSGGRGRLTNSMARRQRRPGPTVEEQPLAPAARPARHGQREGGMFKSSSPQSHKERAPVVPPG